MQSSKPPTSRRDKVFLCGGRRKILRLYNRLNASGNVWRFCRSGLAANSQKDEVASLVLAMTNSSRSNVAGLESPAYPKTHIGGYFQPRNPKVALGPE